VDSKNYFTATHAGHFDSAHFLEEHEGKCKRLHGHRWDVRLSIRTKALNKQGMVADFARLKEILSAQTEKLDHYLLNELFTFTPTAENITKWIYRQVRKELKGNSAWEIAIEVDESPGNTVRYGEF